VVQLFLDGGKFMWPILGSLIIGLLFVIERLVHLIRGLSSGEDFANEVAKLVETDGFDKAKSVCETGKGPVANLCLASLDRAHLGVEEAESYLDKIGSIEMAALEKNMTWISLMIAVAPMLGFLGTVWGMIVSFNDIKVANDISPAIVAAGISQALLTTAFGLIVAVLLQFLQNTCLYIIDLQIVTMQKSTSVLISSIKDKFRNEK